MSSPYINTKLYTTVTLLPKQMNNELYTYLKNNLINRLEGKCYRNYGYITKIYEILEKSDGTIEPENPMAAATYQIKFSCRLCIPLRDKHIICKVERTIPMLTSLSNGPIRVIITNDRINKENFLVGKTGIMVKQTGGASARPLKSGDVVVVRVDGRKFNNRDTIIMCMGVLESLATEQQEKQFAADEYNIQEKYIDYDKYIALDEKDRNIDQIGDETAKELDDDKKELGTETKAIGKIQAEEVAGDTTKVVRKSRKGKKRDGTSDD